MLLFMSVLNMVVVTIANMAWHDSLVFYSRSFEGLSSTLLCKTQYEAAGLGFFLKDLLENVK